MSNPDQYDETIAAARKQGIPISQNDDAARSLVDKLRSETAINEKKELAKINAANLELQHKNKTADMELQHRLWGKTVANLSVCLLTLGMFTLGGMLLYRDKQGDKEVALTLMGISSSLILGNSGVRSLRSLIDNKDSS